MTEPRLWYGFRVMFETSIFPHRAISATHYTRINGGIAVRCEGEIPYGSYARILLLWICTQAVIKKSTRIKFPQISKLLDDLDIAKHGKLVNAINEQIKLLKNCKIEYKQSGKVHPVTLYKVEDDTFVLSGWFFALLCNAPVPVDINALASIRKSTLAMDLLMFLSYRLPKIQTDDSVDIGLDLLEKQLGSSYTRKSHFNAAIRDALAHVKEIYPDANAELFSDHLRLKYSLPHVQKIIELEMQ
jgi:Plasmid encoded RepA protein